MKRFTITLTVLAVGLAAVASVQAKGKGNGGGNGNGNGGGNGGNNASRISSSPRQIATQKFDKQVTTQKFERKVDHKVFSSQKVTLNHVDKSKRFSIAHCPTKQWKKCDFGYCFHGKACCHWEHKCWYPTYGCYCYYCPYTYVEYWFCIEDDCYYPVGFCPLAYKVKYAFPW